MTKEAKLALAAAITAILIAVLASAPEPGGRPQNTREAAEPQAAEIPKKPARPAKAPVLPPAWGGISFVDEFGDVSGRGAASAWVGPVRPMSFPYGDVKARIVVDCYDAWVRFSKAPNLTGGNIRNGYTRYSLAVRVDGKAAGRRGATQAWGSEDIRFTPDWDAISALSSGDSFAVAVPWYGQGSVAFVWSLHGSSAAIRDGC